jgi:hypothetical protein
VTCCGVPQLADEDVLCQEVGDRQRLRVAHDNQAEKRPGDLHNMTVAISKPNFSDRLTEELSAGTVSSRESLLQTRKGNRGGVGVTLKSDMLLNDRL